ncbi:hypothetical protein ACO0LF_02710 [Undibacterium sp. Di27W]|uniref:hypothetical protein n=1 Tax=Undibacterium sp. Di27W TaxID=3413036 RepID=UPI003BF18D37
MNAAYTIAARAWRSRRISACAKFGRIGSTGTRMGQAHSIHVTRQDGAIDQAMSAWQWKSHTFEGIFVEPEPE